jgi:hypothetical protein
MTGHTCAADQGLRHVGGQQDDHLRSCRAAVLELRCWPRGARLAPRPRGGACSMKRTTCLQPACGCLPMTHHWNNCLATVNPQRSGQATSSLSHRCCCVACMATPSEFGGGGSPARLLGVPKRLAGVPWRLLGVLSRVPAVLRRLGPYMSPPSIMSPGPSEILASLTVLNSAFICSRQAVHPPNEPSPSYASAGLVAVRAAEMDARAAASAVLGTILLKGHAQQKELRERGGEHACAPVDRQQPHAASCMGGAEVARCFVSGGMPCSYSTRCIPAADEGLICGRKPLDTALGPGGDPD